MKISDSALEAIKNVDIIFGGKKIKGGHFMESVKVAQDLTSLPVTVLRDMAEKLPKYSEVLNAAIQVREGELQKEVSVDPETGELIESERPDKRAFDIEKLECFPGFNEMKFVVLGIRLNKVYDSYSLTFVLDESYFENEEKKLVHAIRDIEENPTLIKDEDQARIVELQEQISDLKSELETKRLNFPDMGFVLTTKKVEYISRGTRIVFGFGNLRDVVKLLEKRIIEVNENYKCILTNIENV